MSEDLRDREFLKSLSILYVEDDELARGLMSEILSQYSGPLTTACNGEEGFEEFIRCRPDVVVTDIQMPRLDGLGMAERIRGVDLQVPIIVTTAFERSDYFRRSIEVGVDRYVLKPVMIDGLLSALLSCARRLRLERQQEALSDRIRQAEKDEAVTLLAGGVAHNFNNILMVAGGNLELAMLDRTLAGDTLDKLSHAMIAINRASEMSSLMLTFLGQTSARHEPLNLSGVCRLALSSLQASLPPAVELKAELPDLAPVVSANAHQLTQIMNILVTNSREALGDGTGVIRLETGTISATTLPEKHRFPFDWQPHDSLYACMAVSDTGCGIAEKDIDRLFDPFFTSKFTGRGLGLPVVLGICKAHNGAVTVESAVGRGSTFRIILPLAA